MPLFFLLNIRFETSLGVTTGTLWARKYSKMSLCWLETDKAAWMGMCLPLSLDGDTETDESGRVRVEVPGVSTAGM